MKKNILRIVARWGLRFLTVILIIFSLQIAVLAFPQVLVRNFAEHGTVRLYSDFSSNEQIRDLAKEVESRLKTSGFYDSSRTDRVFLIENQSLYTLFVRLSLVRDLPQGFNLSILGNLLLVFQESTLSQRRPADSRNTASGKEAIHISWHMR